MPYCLKCGVEVDKGIDRCPLCGASILDDENPRPVEKEYPDTAIEEKPRLGQQERRRLAWEVASILGAIVVVVVALSDLRGSLGFTWSIYPIGAVVLAWTTSTLFIFLHRRPLIAAPAAVIATVGYLTLIAFASGSLTWLFDLALPILALLVVITVALGLIISRLSTFGLNVVAYFGVAVMLLSVGVDSGILHYLTGRLQLSWSVVVMQALVPFCGIMFFLHYRLRHRFDLKRIFHR